MEDYVTAVMGGIIALLVGWLAGRREANLESEKWRRAREDDLKKETRLAVADLTRKLALAAHSMVWLTWKATHRPSEFTREDIANYDEEMHRVIPDIVGAHAVVSALEPRLGDKLQPLTKRIYALDADIATEATKLIPSLVDSSFPQTGAVKGLDALEKEAREFKNALITTVTQVLSDIYPELSKPELN